MRCRPTPAGEGALAAGRRYALDANEEPGTLHCTSVVRDKAKLLVTFEGYDSVEAARALTGRTLYLDRNEIVLAPGEYLDDDLIGLELRTETGEVLGVVGAVEHYPANDCLVIEPGRALVPLVKAFVRDIDLESRTIVMSLPEGLLS